MGTLEIVGRSETSLSLAPRLLTTPRTRCPASGPAGGGGGEACATDPGTSPGTSPAGVQPASPSFHRSESRRRVPFWRSRAISSRPTGPRLL